MRSALLRRVVVVSLFLVACTPDDDGVGGVLDEGGGILELGGVTISTEAGDLVGPVEVTVRDVAAPEPFPEGLELVGQAVDISIDDQSLISEPIRITMRYPADVADEDRLVVLHFDEARGYEGVTILEHDVEGDVIVFESRVFSIFGVFEPSIDLPDSYSVDFSPGRHGWNVSNPSNFFSPRGQCLGMSAYATWCYESCGADLFSMYDETQSKRVIHRASQAQSQDGAGASFGEHQKIGDSRLVNSLKAYLYSFKRPQIFLMRSKTGGHATVVYGYTNSSLLFYDVNHPGQEQTLPIVEVPSVGLSQLGTYGAYDSFGYISWPSLGRTEDFSTMTSQARGNFKISDHLRITEPEEGATVRTAEVAVEGTVSGLNSEVTTLVAEGEDATPNLLAAGALPVLTGNGDFEYIWELQEGANILYVFSGASTSGAQSTTIRNGDTLALEVDYEPCDTYLDCASCAQAEGCLWCGDGATGCVAEEDEPCSSPITDASSCGECEARGSCGDCTGTEGCVWCDDGGARRCQPSDAGGCGSTVVDPSGCSACDSQDSCSGCTAEIGCIWCDDAGAQRCQPSGAGGCGSTVADPSGCLDCEGSFDDAFYGDLLVEFGRIDVCSEIRRCYEDYAPGCMAGMDMWCNQMFIADCPTEHDVDEATRICEDCP